MSIPRCTSWLGHNFEPRYSYSEPRGDVKISHGRVITESPEILDTYLRAYQPKTYHHDICTRCGATIQVAAHAEVAA